MSASSSSRPVVLVTGASRGIGRAIAIRCAEAGATVAVGYKSNSAMAEETLSLLAGSGAGHKAFQADVTNPADCERLVADVVAAFGRLDTLVNNAGVLEDVSIHTESFDAFAAGNKMHLDANATSAANLTFLACKVMAKQAADADGLRGRVVNVTSRSAYQGSAVAVTTYAASKAAMSLLGQTLARTFGGRGIAFFAVAPTFVMTDMVKGRWEEVKEKVLAQHPIDRIPSADEVGRVGQWLAMSAPLPVTGTIVDVNGASHLHH
jgi:NAD(P)-dependent dehydrogenase (short-subunit alcohol dehydrogenase family)